MRETRTYAIMARTRLNNIIRGSTQPPALAGSLGHYSNEVSEIHDLLLTRVENAAMKFKHRHPEIERMPELENMIVDYLLLSCDHGEPEQTIEKFWEEVHGKTATSYQRYFMALAEFASQGTRISPLCYMAYSNHLVNWPEKLNPRWATFLAIELPFAVDVAEIIDEKEHHGLHMYQIVQLYRHANIEYVGQLLNVYFDDSFEKYFLGDNQDLAESTRKATAEFFNDCLGEETISNLKASNWRWRLT